MSPTLVKLLCGQRVTFGVDFVMGSVRNDVQDDLATSSMVWNDRHGGFARLQGIRVQRRWHRMSRRLKAYGNAGNGCRQSEFLVVRGRCCCM